MKKVVGLGACVLDTLLACDKYPVEDTKQRANDVLLAGGGPVGNALVVLSKLGISASVLGAFADDTAGKYLLDDFAKYGVDTANAVVVKNTHSFTSYILLSQENKTRTCVFDRGTVPDCADNVNLSALDGADVVHLDGNYLQSAIHLAKEAKKRGITVSLDAGGLYEGIVELLPYVDVLIPSAEFAMGLTRQADIPSAMKVLYEQYRPQILVVTDGANGGYYYQDGEAKHYDSVPVKAVDTNGAGDTFHGAFVAAYCEGKSVEDCCKFASAVASYKCGFTGARTYELNPEIARNLVK